MTEMENANILDDFDLADLADLKGFEPMPAGEHRVTINWEKKTVNNKTSFELTMTLVEHVALDEGQVGKAAGFEANVLFGIEKEVQQGMLKAVLAPLAEATGQTKCLAIMEASNGMQVLVRTKLRADKEDKEKFYTQLKALTVEA